MVCFTVTVDVPKRDSKKKVKEISILKVRKTNTTIIHELGSPTISGNPEKGGLESGRLMEAFGVFAKDDKRKVKDDGDP